MLEGENYLLASDFPWSPDASELAREGMIRENAMPVSRLLDGLKKSGARVKIVILDACRDNPLKNRIGAKSIGGAKGLAALGRVPTGTYVVYSAGIGESALDRLSNTDPNPNSLFMRYLLPELKVPGKPFDDAVKAARIKVQEDAWSRRQHEQHPAIYDELYGKWSLVTGGAVVAPPVSPPQAAADHWIKVEPGKTYRLPVLDNDRAANGGALRVASVDPVSVGRVEVTADGQAITYTAPTDGTAEEVRFRYWVREENGGEAEGSVTLALVRLPKPTQVGGGVTPNTSVDGLGDAFTVALRDAVLNVEKARYRGTDYDYWPDGGVRNIYFHLYDGFNFEIVQSLYGGRVFLSGPHSGGELHLEDDHDFGHYNPDFLEWFDIFLEKLLHNKEFVFLSKGNVGKYFLSNAKKYYEAYDYLSNDFEIYSKLSLFMMDRLKKSERWPWPPSVCDNPGTRYEDVEQLARRVCYDLRGGYITGTAISFWLRRHEDGTEHQFFRILTKFIRAYDPQWIDNLSRDGEVFER